MSKYKYFLFSDTHGCYDALMFALDKAGFNIEDPTHMLVGVGDYFDRGQQSDKIFKFLKSRKLAKRIYLVRGNHDDMLKDFLTGVNDGFFNSIYNGMNTTIESFSKLSLTFSLLQLDPNLYVQEITKHYPTLVKWLLNKLKPGFQIDKYKITHAGMKPIMNGDENEPVWVINNWANTPYFVSEYPDDGYIHIFGHWHARLLRGQFGYPHDTHETFQHKNFIGLDACTNISDRVNVYVIDSDSLPIVLE